MFWLVKKKNTFKCENRAVSLTEQSFGMLEWFFYVHEEAEESHEVEMSLFQR